MEDNKRRPEPEEGPNGVDRWTSNGYGLEIGGKKVIPPQEEKDEIEEIEYEEE